MKLSTKLFFPFILFSYYSFSQELPVPGNLTAKHKIDSAVVDLNWFIPGTANWFQYFETPENNLYGGNINFSVGMMLDTLQLKAFTGYRISKIAIIPTDNSTTYQIKIWQKQGNYTTQIAVQGLDDIIYNQWNTVELIDDIYIEEGKSYIIGYYCATASNNSACYSKNGVKPGYSDLINTGSGFFSISEQNLSLSWNIKAYLEPKSTDSIPTPEHYIIYRNDQNIGQSNSNYFKDTLKSSGLYNYQVSAQYGEQESLKSEAVEVIYDIQRIEKNYVVIEEFTSVECVMCPGAANGIRDMVSNGFQVAPIALHTENYGYDPFSNASVTERERYYSGAIGGYPTTIIAGNTAIGGGSPGGSIFDYLAPYYHEAISVKTPIGMDGFLYEDLYEDYNVSININQLGIIPDEPIKMYATLTEDLIEYDWLNLGSVEYVFRKYLTNPSSNSVTLIPDSIINYILPFDLPEEDLKEHYEVIVFLQNTQTNEILNSIYLKFHEIEYNNHFFKLSLNQKPLDGATIQIGKYELISNPEGEATFKQNFSLDSIPFTIKKGDELLHEGYFQSSDSIIAVELINIAISNNYDEAIELYPNPVKDELHILNAENTILSVFTILGTPMVTISIDNNNKTLDVSQWPDGFYILKTEDHSGAVMVKKIYIEN